MRAEIREELGKVAYGAYTDGADAVEWHRMDEQKKEVWRLVANDVVRGVFALFLPFVQAFVPADEMEALSEEVSKDNEGENS